MTSRDLIRSHPPLVTGIISLGNLAEASCPRAIASKLPGTETVGMLWQLGQHRRRVLFPPPSLDRQHSAKVSTHRFGLLLY